MDIRRVFDKKTQKFNYIDKKSKKRVNKSLAKHIDGLRIPPGYTKVHISKNKSSKVLAIGEDSKQRKQYIYNQEHIEKQKELKFSDLIYFGKKIKRIRRDILANIERCQQNNNIRDKNCVISIILFLIDRCNFRVGCDRYKKLYNSYGVTTLNKEHFEFKPNKVSIEFIGKKGVVNKSDVTHKNVCSVLQKLCYKNNKEYVFCYEHNGEVFRITERHINDYLKKYHKTLTVKMFRTWNANYILLKEILNYDIPEDDKGAKKNINSIVKKAAGNLHHSNHVSKKSYMNNEIIDLYMEEPMKFKRLVDFFRKRNGDLPTIGRLLNLILKFICDKKKN